MTPAPIQSCPLLYNTHTNVLLTRSHSAAIALENGYPLSEGQSKRRGILMWRFWRETCAVGCKQCKMAHAGPRCLQTWITQIFVGMIAPLSRLSGGSLGVGSAHTVTRPPLTPALPSLSSLHLILTLIVASLCHRCT